MIKIVRAKLHGIHVTGCELDYHGSITLDPLICRKAGIFPLEFVYIWNKHSGHRISTYVIYGDPGSRCCVINGAAARTCQKGDPVIVCATEYVASPENLHTIVPNVLTFLPSNDIENHFLYEVGQDVDSGYTFSIKELS